MKLNAIHIDTCLPSFFSGDNRTHISVPVHRGITPKAFRDACHQEICDGAFGGNYPTQGLSDKETDRWYRAAHAAINRDLIPRVKGCRRLFLDLDATDENDDCCESVYAYIILVKD